MPPRGTEHSVKGGIMEPKLACSFCGKDQDQVGKLLAGPHVNICDECIDLCNDIIEKETEIPDQSLSAATKIQGGTQFIKPQIVTRYVNEQVIVVSSSDPRGEYWVCEGCGWRIKLPAGKMPPIEHSEEIVLSQWPEPPGKLPPRELIPSCPQPKWRKVVEQIAPDVKIQKTD